MRLQNTITERVKYLIKYLIGKGIAENQEDLGKKMGINNKTYLSQLVNNSRPNEKFIDYLVNFAPNFNKEWLYNESIENPFLDGNAENPTSEFSEMQKNITQILEQKLRKMEENLLLLQKDVKYYADMADSRLQTINVQNKLIDNYEKQLIK
jgi:transcriptional regulator with XRE-family HTH domain